MAELRDLTMAVKLKTVVKGAISSNLVDAKRQGDFQWETLREESNGKAEIGNCYHFEAIGTTMPS